jgi:propionyl-CoA carboxylase alpha chain
MAGPGVRFAARRVVLLGEERREVDVSGELGGPITVTVAGGPKPRIIAVESNWWFGNPLWEGRIGGESRAVQVSPIVNGVALTSRGVRLEARVYTPREAELAGLMPGKKRGDSHRTLRCPMPGLVLSIAVAQGQEVKAGEALAVVEAMKMENILRAERDGVVAKLHVKPGDSLAVDAVILEFK